MGELDVSQSQGGNVLPPIAVHNNELTQESKVVATTADKTTKSAENITQSHKLSKIQARVSSASLNTIEDKPTDLKIVNAPSNVKEGMSTQKNNQETTKEKRIVLDGNGKEYQQLTNGACKDVLVPASGDRQYVYYLARRGNTDALKDLKEDVQNAHMIRDVIIKKHSMKTEQEAFKKALRDVYGENIPKQLQECNNFEALCEKADELIEKNVMTNEAFNKLNVQIAESMVEANKIIPDLENLAVNYVILEGADQINGEYTVKADRANAGDLDKLLSQDLTIQDRGDLCIQMVSSISQVHSAGYLHCDLKPENILIDRVPDTDKFKLMLSDWGRTKPISEKPYPVKGNWRFMPWEANITLKGEVCSAAICMIKVLERSVLKDEEDYLCKPKNRGTLEANMDKNRRGIEAFLIESKGFRCIESNNGRAIGKIVANRLSQAFTRTQVNLSEVSQKELEQMGMEKDRYINELTSRLENEGKLTNTKANELNAILKEMTHINKEMRPQLSKVLPRLKSVFKEK